jgi:pimeloyl-ACP methyl ester carboxylesterase
MSLDASMALIEGPWEHRFVAANGARFHVAEQGEGPVVLLLHGFPQFWWAWRHQMQALADAGYRACAMDLRGYGASDKPPRGYDTRTSATDVASVLRSLGASRAVVVGHGWGGWIAWSMPTLQPTVTRAIASLSMPHPLVFRRASFANPRQLKANAYLGGLQRPFVPERQMTVHGGYVQRLLREWASPEGIWPSTEEAKIYSDAMALPFVAHSAAEYYRWVVRSQIRPDGWRFAARMRTIITLPVLQLHGEHDRAVLPDTSSDSAGYVTGPFERHLVPGAGHFLPEEAPDVVNEHLLSWLDTLR